MYVRKNDLSFIVNDNDLYVGLDGTQWANTNKDTITELAKVTETPRPDNFDNINIKFTVNSNYQQVWTSTPISLAAKKAEFKLDAKNKYVEWFKNNSDDFYIAKARTGIEVPQDIVNAGLELDDRYTEYKADVNNCTTMQQLKDLGEFNV